MPEFRIIYVPGMKPKPPAEEYRRALLRVLLCGLARVDPRTAKQLEAEPEAFRLIPWTFGFYRRHADIEPDRPGIEALLRHPDPSAVDIAEIDSIARKVARSVRVLGDAAPWFGRIIARSETRLTLREARDYLSNHGGLGDEVRQMLKTELRDSWHDSCRVLLIGHSLGSVIAYDSLWELTHIDGTENVVDLFITLGSPLASRFVAHRVRGASETGAAKYPANIRRWANFSARAEMTALHPELRPYYGEMVDLGLLESLDDYAEIYNHFRGPIGLNPHKSYGYLANREFAERVSEWLAEVTRPGAR
ncbi:MAG TPA: hypothetical protein VIV14_05545 [Gammaproteobacteria bacterium]